MQTSRTTNTIKTILLVLFFCAVIYLYVNYRTELTQEAIRSWVEGYGMFAPIAYGVLYATLLIILFPASLMSILAGTLFGKVWGTIIVVIAATTAAAIAFFVARTLGKQVTAYLEQGVVSQLMQKINKQCESHGLRAFFTMRCLGMPYIAFSYAAGLVRKARFKDFILGTLFANMIFSPAFVYFGEQATQGPRALVLPVILLILVYSIPYLMKQVQQ